MYVRMIAVAVVLAAIAAPPLGVAAQESAAPCREVRNLDATQYWFWDGYFGLVDLHDFTHERWGRLAVDPYVCFRIALVVIDNPQQKSAGYRQAVGELIQWVVEDRKVDDDRSDLAIDRLDRLTGEDFKTRAEWIEWWQESQDFIVWSEDKERMVIVSDAREGGDAIRDDALLLDPEEYWFYSGRGWLSDSRPVGDFIYGSVLIPPHDFTFRVESDDLDDRDAKEDGYRRALENMIVDGLMSPELTGNGLESIIGQITRLTGEAHQDRDGWVAWWERSRSRLVLSPSGDRLVVRE